MTSWSFEKWTQVALFVACVVVIADGLAWGSKNIDLSPPIHVSINH